LIVIVAATAGVLGAVVMQFLRCSRLMPWP
jgi:hypothetical protein